jgi:hypothetical protein
MLHALVILISVTVYKKFLFFEHKLSEHLLPLNCRETTNPNPFIYKKFDGKDAPFTRRLKLRLLKLKDEWLLSRMLFHLLKRLYLH